MTIQIKKLKYDPSKPIVTRTLLYGDPGCGKSFFAASAQDVPEMSEVLIIDCDGGSTTLVSRGDISVVSTKSVNDVEEVLWLLASNDPSVANIRTVVLDGVTELQRTDLAQIAESEAEKKKARDIDMSELQDFKRNKARMLRVLQMARDLNRNVIVTSWAKKKFPNIPGTQQANKDAPPTQITPDIGNAILNTLLGFVDNVFYLFMHDDVRYLVTNKYNNVDAKCRDVAVAAALTTVKEGKPVPYLVNPTLSDVYARIKGAYANKQITVTAKDQK